MWYGKTRKQEWSLKYYKIYDDYRYIFMREDNKRLVLFNGLNGMLQVKFTVRRSSAIIWTDRVTGETFEVHRHMWE